MVIIGFYCKLTSQPRPLAPQSNNFAPVPLPFLPAVVVFALVIYTNFITTFPMSSLRVVRQVRPLLSSLLNLTVPPTGRATSLSLFGGKTYSATSAAFISYPRSHCIYYYVYLFYINLLLLCTVRAPFIGLSIFIRTLICYGFTTWLLASAPLSLSPFLIHLGVSLILILVLVLLVQVFWLQHRHKTSLGVARKM